MVPPSARTKDKVRRAMEEPGHHPNLIARSLVSAYARVIGLDRAWRLWCLAETPLAPPRLPGNFPGGTADHHCAIQVVVQAGWARIDGSAIRRWSARQNGWTDFGFPLLPLRPASPLVALAHRAQFPFVILGRPLTAPFWQDSGNIPGWRRRATTYLYRQGSQASSLLWPGNRVSRFSRPLWGWAKGLTGPWTSDEGMVRFSPGSSLNDRQSYKVIEKLTMCRHRCHRDHRCHVVAEGPSSASMNTQRDHSDHHLDSAVTQNQHWGSCGHQCLSNWEENLSVPPTNYQR